MSAATILAYLFGNRQAIEQIASSPNAVWLGLAFLLSTGLARCYDTKDLGRQPWHLLLPFAASFTLSLALYGALCGFLAIKDRPPPFLAGYWSLLGLFLLTAPLAWLYGIPFQRFLDPRRAVRCRLGVLGLVAGWRVAVMTRALAVLLDDRLGPALYVVLLVADVAVLAGLFLTRSRRGSAPSTPMLVSFMGGIEPSTVAAREQQLMTCSAALIAVLGVVTLPIWLWASASAPFSASNWRQRLSAPSAAAPSWSTWLLAGGALVVFLALLPRGQRAQRLKTRIEALLQQGQVAVALQEMSGRPASAFPPDWSPPPRGDYREPPTLLDVLEVVVEGGPSAWVRAAYLARLKDYLAEPLWYWYYDAELERLVALLARLPEGPDLARAMQEAATRFERLANALAEMRAGAADDPEEPALRARYVLHPGPAPTGRRAETIEALRKLAEQGAPS